MCVQNYIKIIGLWLTITPKFFRCAAYKARYARAPLRGAKQGCPHRPQGAKRACPVQKSAPRLTIIVRGLVFAERSTLFTPRLVLLRAKRGTWPLGGRVDWRPPFDAADGARACAEHSNLPFTTTRARRVSECCVC